MSEQALDGIKVLDLTHYIAGPYCTKLLSSFGAQVIKIEKPGVGDGARNTGPFLNNEPGIERSGLFLYLNTNKKSITLNLKTKAGVKIFKELLKDADVVVESFSPGVMSRLGLDYESLKNIKPDLIMTAISNFGQTGPYRDYKANHLIEWGMHGGRYTDGEPGRRPRLIGGWLSHYIAGVYGAISTNAALYWRNEANIGNYIDVSILEAQLFMTCYPAQMYSYTGELHNALCQNLLGILPCKDGYIGVNFMTWPKWQLLCGYFGLPDMPEDPRFNTWNNLRKNFKAAVELYQPKLMQKTREELFREVTELGIPFGLVPTTEEILELPQHEARGYFTEVEHPVMGKVTMPGAPVKLTGSPAQINSAAPLLGEHNEEIYSQYLGYSKDDLVRLSEMGVI